MRTATRLLALLSLFLAAPALMAAPRPDGKFPLTVDSIMRGPDLVGYPPDSLRWSADSQKLYFDWRKPGEDEASTYVVSRDGGTPTRLDDAAKNVPRPNGRWDKARKRVLFTDRGDIVMIDASGARTWITRTTAGESSPRWAKNDTAVTYVRDGNLFVVPTDGAGIQQLTDVAPKKADPRLTDSQKFMREEEEKLLDAVKEQKDRKKKAEEKDKLEKLPALELQDRQSAADLMLSPDGTHVFVLVSERPAAARNVIVPNYVNETGYTEDIPGRTAVGDAQNRTLLAVMNLKTGKTAWADGSFAPPVDEPAPGKVEGAAKKAEREIRWSMPDVSDEGKLAVAAARSADNKDRWYVTLDAETGKTRVLDALHDDAWIREAGGGFGSSGVTFLPDNHHVWFLSERDGWMHLYTLDVADTSAKAKQLTSGKWEVTDASLSRDGKKFYITSTEAHPGERHLYTMPLDGGARTGDVDDRSTIAEVSPTIHARLIYSSEQQATRKCSWRPTVRAAATQVTNTPDGRMEVVQLDRPEGDHVQGPRRRRRYARLFTPEMIGEARSEPSWRGLRPRRWLPAERAQILVHLTTARYVPQPASRRGGYVAWT
jgi:Tol biopolymer transport system component